MEKPRLLWRVWRGTSPPDRGSEDMWSIFSLASGFFIIYSFTYLLRLPVIVIAAAWLSPT